MPLTEQLKYAKTAETALHLKVDVGGSSCIPLVEHALLYDLTHLVEELLAVCRGVGHVKDGLLHLCVPAE